MKTKKGQHVISSYVMVVVSVSYSKVLIKCLTFLLLIFFVVKKIQIAFVLALHLKTMKKAFSMLMKFLDFIFLYIYI